MNTEEGKKCKRRIGQKRIPSHDHEIWFEILTRLSIKTLFWCQVVCKSWKRKVKYLKFNSKSLPLCGLIFKSTLGVSNISNVDMNYINMTTKEVTSMRTNVGKSLIVYNASNGFDEYRFMSDLSFDFGGLFGKTSSPAPIISFPSIDGKELSFDFNGLFIDKRVESHSCFFAIHRGLVLVVHDDGNYLVHNPLTREVTRLPKPPSFKRYDSKYIPLEKVGFIIKFTTNDLSTRWFYHVVRVCRVSKVIEVYQSYRRPLCWRVSELRMDEELMQANWCWENNAILSRARTLFFLTNKDQGVAIKFGRRSRVRAYGFSLPRIVQEGFKNARLGECGECLHISYYDTKGVWIWKHGDNGKTVTPEAWIPLLEISHNWQMCKPMAMECLSNVLNAGNLVVPLAFHPEDEIVFLRVKSSVFGYDLANDMFHKIADIDEKEIGSSAVVLPYSPCLASVEAKSLLDDVMY